MCLSDCSINRRASGCDGESESLSKTTTNIQALKKLTERKKPEDNTSNLISLGVQKDNILMGGRNVEAE